MKKVVLSFLIIFFLANCKFENSPGSKTSTNDQNDAPLPEMSIYNLPSKWTSHNNEEIELKDLRGDIVVAVMIYTSCKASCPRLVADMREVASNVPDKFDGEVTYVLVSIDPETDTPERLKSFSIENEMDSGEWLFLRGSLEDTRDFAATLAVSYKQISPIDFSHSNIISVFDREGQLYHQKEGLGINSKEVVSKIIELGS